MSNREELTRQAEKSLRQGRVEDAIALYQELADLTPVDWGIVKQLADLFERAGQLEAASRQFCRWADHLAVEGFHSKAGALYKKVLKLEPTHEHALWQLGEVSLELKLRADARLAFQRVVELRQRRGDTAGAEIARQRLATLEAAAPTPGRTPLVGVPALSPRAETAPAPIVDASRQSVPAPIATPAVTPDAVGTAAPAPSVALPAPPLETPERRLARLRHEAEEAERFHPIAAEARWQAVLDADPQDVATRMRLVQHAMDRRDLEAADRLALPLDASETGALVLLVELAWRRGRPDAVRRLVAARVHAGASPGHVLAPFDALAPRLPDAAREALAAAVTAWKTAGQPGHAVAALELEDRRGLLGTEAYLHWVEICVDAGVAGLSRAQAALARAYVAEGRVAEARAVAEDVFVREAGAEPYRALLLEVLDRLGEANPHRVLVDLLTPPSEVTDELAVPPPVVDEVVELDLDLTLNDTVDRLTELNEPASPPAAVAMMTDRLADLPVPESRPLPRLEVHSCAAEAGAAAAAHAAPPPSVQEIAVEASAADANATTPSFDWAFLLGRDIDDAWASALPSAPPTPVVPQAGVLAAVTNSVVMDPSASTENTDSHDESVDATPTDDLVDLVDAHAMSSVSSDPAVAQVQLDPSDEGLSDISATVPEPTAESALALIAVAPQEEEPKAAPPAPIVVVREPAALGAPEHDPYEVRTPVDPVLAKIAAAQPQMAPPTEVLPPTFSVPSSWFDTTPAERGGSARQRHPEDAYLFEDDDQAPSRWGARRAMAPPAPQVSAPISHTNPDPPAAAGERDEMWTSIDATAAASSPAPLAPSDPAPHPLAVTSGPEPTHGSESMPPEIPEPAPDLVEEEVDLTQLLEELRQFDTVLPDPPARPVLSGSADEASKMLAALESPSGDDLASTRPSLSELLTPPPPLDEPAVVDAPAFGPDTTTELDAVFADLQRHTDGRLVAEQQLAAGRVFLAAGLVSEAARAFERASQAPRSRFAAAQALAELHRSRGQLTDAVSWYEQAAAAPVPDADVKRPVLYDLAESLEALGETDRALGVLLDLLSQVEDYRDARARLDRLLRVDAGG